MLLKPRVFVAAVAAVMVFQGVCWAEMSPAELYEWSGTAGVHNMEGFNCSNSPLSRTGGGGGGGWVAASTAIRSGKGGNGEGGWVAVSTAPRSGSGGGVWQSVASTSSILPGSGAFIDSKPWYETSADTKVKDLYSKMNEAVTAVDDQFKTKIGDVDSAIETAKTAQKTLSDAAWKTCKDKLSAAIKDSKWTEFNTILTDWKAADDKIKSDAKPGIDALTQKIAGFRTEQADAVKAVKDSFIAQMNAFKPAANSNYGLWVAPQTSSYDLNAYNDSWARYVDNGMGGQ